MKNDLQNVYLITNVNTAEAMFIGRINTGTQNISTKCQGWIKQIKLTGKIQNKDAGQEHIAKWLFDNKNNYRVIHILSNVSLDKAIDFKNKYLREHKCPLNLHRIELKSAMSKYSSKDQQYINSIGMKIKQNFISGGSYKDWKIGDDCNLLFKDGNGKYKSFNTKVNFINSSETMFNVNGVKQQYPLTAFFTDQQLTKYSELNHVSIGAF